ncbi:MAG: hypothetical protein J2P50_05270 [Hyphomicrobiaceae bacterium]|nr:hypothetical protein [Hyphomicrobiaceae bacterium]
MVLALCLFTVILALEQRGDALQEATERRDALAQLEARLRGDSRHPRGSAPAAAFLEAPTQGIATAQLQSYVAQATGNQNAIIVSTNVEPAKKNDAQAIRIEATVDSGLNSLQALLHQLETKTPYVFVESLAVQLPGGASTRPAQDPLLRSTLVLRAIWRKGAP